MSFWLGHDSWKGTPFPETWPDWLLCCHNLIQVPDPAARNLLFILVPASCYFQHMSRSRDQWPHRYVMLEYGYRYHIESLDLPDSWCYCQHLITSLNCIIILLDKGHATQALKTEALCLETWLIRCKPMVFGWSVVVAKSSTRKLS